MQPSEDRGVRLLSGAACAGMFVFGIVMALVGAILPALAGRLQFDVGSARQLFHAVHVRGVRVLPHGPQGHGPVHRPGVDVQVPQPSGHGPGYRALTRPGRPVYGDNDALAHAPLLPVWHGNAANPVLAGGKGRDWRNLTV